MSLYQLSFLFVLLVLFNTMSLRRTLNLKKPLQECTHLAVRQLSHEPILWGPFCCSFREPPVTLVEPGRRVIGPTVVGIFPSFLEWKLCLYDGLLPKLSVNLCSLGITRKNASETTNFIFGGAVRRVGLVGHFPMFWATKTLNGGKAACCCLSVCDFKF